MDYNLKEPRLVDGVPLHIAGIEGHYTREQTAQIPGQWDRFNAAVNAADLRPADNVFYAVVYPSTPMRYVTGVIVPPRTPLPEGWIVTSVPAQQYAVFAETASFAENGGVEGMRKAWTLIFSDWLPRSAFRQSPGPMLERYDAGWVKSGAFEIWIPVEPRS